MAVNTGSNIVYQDLVNMVLNTICNRCQNIDSIKSSVPAQLKNGYSRTISSSTASATFRVNDSFLKAVPRSTVQSQFNSFMSSRGVSTKPMATISARGVVNFFAHAAAFAAARCVQVAGNDTASTAVFYNSGSVSYQNVSYNPSNVPDTDAQLSSNINELVSALNNTQNFHTIVYSIQVNCCSCSSSSSSCSSSSSSSMFIGYMRLD